MQYQNENLHNINIEKSIEEIDETFKEIEKTMASIEKKAYDGTRDILKYFDRIHDKLFTFNNIMIVGFFTLSKLKENVPVELIFIPFINLVILIYIEYKMMQKSRFETNILETNFDEIPKLGVMISKTNYYSLLSIFSTSVVAIFFLFNLLK